jgi:cytochrome c2
MFKTRLVTVQKQLCSLSQGMSNWRWAITNYQLPMTVTLMILAGVLSACASAQAATTGQPIVPASDPERGRQALSEYGCGACHTIPGVEDANATVGPPLNDWADRHYIAGLLSNTPANLIRWIQYPQAIEPGTAMPNMGVTDQDARDMAAYLYTLKRDDNEFDGWLGGLVSGSE